MSAMPSTVRIPGTSTSSKTTPRAAQVVDHALEVVDLPRHLRVRARCFPAGREQHEAAGSALVQQAAGPFLDRLEAELLRVEAPGALEVLRRQPRRDVAVTQRQAFAIRRFAATRHGASVPGSRRGRRAGGVEISPNFAIRFICNDRDVASSRPFNCNEREFPKLRPLGPEPYLSHPRGTISGWRKHTHTDRNRTPSGGTRAARPGCATPSSGCGARSRRGCGPSRARPTCRCSPAPARPVPPCGRASAPRASTRSSRVLMLLFDGHTTLRVSEVAWRLNISKATASRHLDRAERAGLVDKLYLPLDRRGTWARSTCRGRELRATIVEHLDAQCAVRASLRSGVRHPRDTALSRGGMIRAARPRRSPGSRSRRCRRSRCGTCRPG